ncbi:hypothetical protein AA313_de0207708 [Arthrobotrys entomopaga]|nr:hypothetical protein AA313_de0207708 [Arthrobotrys entomopaga]
MSTDYIDYNFSMTVPLPFVHLSISDQELSRAVISERNICKPKASRSLNASGKYAYRHAIASYLAINYPDVDRTIIERVQDIMSAPMPVASISLQLGLGMVDNMHAPGYQGLEELVEAEQRVFYVYMSAIFQERTNVELQQFIGDIFEANKDKIADLVEKSMELDPVVEQQSNEEGVLLSFGPVGMDSVQDTAHMVIMPQPTPRKRKQRSSGEGVCADTSDAYVSKRRRV